MPQPPFHDSPLLGESVRESQHKGLAQGICCFIFSDILCQGSDKDPNSN